MWNAYWLYYFSLTCFLNIIKKKKELGDSGDLGSLSSISLRALG